MYLRLSTSPERAIRSENTSERVDFPLKSRQQALFEASVIFFGI